MSEDDIRLAKKVINDVFLERRKPSNKEEIRQRLSVIHTILGMTMDSDLHTDELRQGLEDLEEALNEIENSFASFTV